MKLACIFHQDKDITSVSGIPFYLSTGENSGHAKTWFPFTGILEESNKKFARGWYQKPFVWALKAMPMHFSSFIISNFDNGKTLVDRFVSLPCLLISSWLGGGLWTSLKGVGLQNMLRKEYPEFYQSWGDVELLPCEMIFQENDIEEVNKWLCEKANVENYLELYKTIPMFMEDLLRLNQAIENSGKRRNSCSKILSEDENENPKKVKLNEILDEYLLQPQDAAFDMEQATQLNKPFLIREDRSVVHSLEVETVACNAELLREGKLKFS
jgi:hypothetical protein